MISSTPIKKNWANSPPWKRLNANGTTQVLARLKDRIVSAYQILSDVSHGRRKVPTTKVALLAGGLAYLALPLDLVCDAIPVAGLLDDGIVLAWIFSQCADLFKDDGRDSR